MPASTLATPDVPAPVPPPDSPTAQHSLVTVDIGRSKQTNGLQLIINAKPLHDLLDSMGARYSNSYGNGPSYDNQPHQDFDVVYGSQLSTKVFLKRAYPYTIDLGRLFSSPPSFQRLTDIARSARNAVSIILDHYRPIDISYHVFKKAV